MDRNYQGVNRGSSQIWGPYLAMRQQERDMSGLFYRVKNVRVSPYLELQADSLSKISHKMQFRDSSYFVRDFSYHISLNNTTITSLDLSDILHAGTLYHPFTGS